MSSILDGVWFDIANKNEFDNVLRCGSKTYHQFNRARCQRGEYVGPGYYLLLSYTQRCSRNCRDDFVREFLSPKEVMERAREEIKELTEKLRLAKNMYRQWRGVFGTHSR